MERGIMFATLTFFLSEVDMDMLFMIRVCDVTLMGPNESRMRNGFSEKVHPLRC